MRLLFLSTESSVHLHFSLPMAEVCRERGHEVILGCSEEPGERGHSSIPDLIARGFQVIVLPYTRRLTPLRDAWAVVQTIRAIHRVRPFVVWTQTAKAGWIGRLSAWLCGVPHVVHTAHAWPFHDHLPRWKKRVYARLERLAVRWCHDLVCDSQTEAFLGRLALSPPRPTINIIPMGVPVLFDPLTLASSRAATRTFLGIPSHALVIGNVCRFVPDKGLTTWLKIFKEIPSSTARPVYGLLVGNGPLAPALAQLATRLRIADRLIFSGYQTDTPAYLSAMDIFLSPTRREGFGVSILEAMSLGLPVVTTKLPVLAEWIQEGQHGLLCPLDEVGSFAKAVTVLAESSSFRAQMGAAAQAHVRQHYTQRGMVEAYAKVLRVDC